MTGTAAEHTCRPTPGTVPKADVYERPRAERILSARDEERKYDVRFGGGDRRRPRFYRTERSTWPAWSVRPDSPYRSGVW